MLTIYSGAILGSPESRHASCDHCRPEAKPEELDSDADFVTLMTGAVIDVDRMYCD